LGTVQQRGRGRLGTAVATDVFVADLDVFVADLSGAFKRSRIDGRAGRRAGPLGTIQWGSRVCKTAATWESPHAQKKSGVARSLVRRGGALANGARGSLVQF